MHQCTGSCKTCFEHQSPKAQKSSIESCLSAISKLWSFDPAETSTWAKAGRIGARCFDWWSLLLIAWGTELFAQRSSNGRYSCFVTALCMSISTCQFKTAKHLLVKTCKFLKSFTMKSNKNQECPCSSVFNSRQNWTILWKLWKCR